MIRRPGPEGSIEDAEDHPVNADASAGARMGARGPDMAKPDAEAGAHVGAPGPTPWRESPPVTSTEAEAPPLRAEAHDDESEHAASSLRTDIRVGMTAPTTPIACAAPRMDTTDTGLRAHVGAGSRLDAAILRTQAKTALTGLGWKPAIAHAAVTAALAAAGSVELTVERLIFESLKRCPMSKA